MISQVKGPFGTKYGDDYRAFLGWHLKRRVSGMILVARYIYDLGAGSNTQGLYYGL